MIAQSIEEALGTVRDMFGGGFGDAGETVVVEEFLEGEEASFIVIADGTHALPCASSQDHKRLKDGDAGPNTGGMGAYSPAPVVTAAVHERVMREVIAPTLEGLANDGTPYTGFLYAGLMIDAQRRAARDRIQLPLWRSGSAGGAGAAPLGPAGAVPRGARESPCAVSASNGIHARRSASSWPPPGYPGPVQLGGAITGLDRAAQLPGKVYHAGTEQREGAVVTSGGRVLCAVGLGEKVAQAQRAAYDLIAYLNFPGAQFRHDIGYRAIARDS